MSSLENITFHCQTILTMWTVNQFFNPYFQETKLKRDGP